MLVETLGLVERVGETLLVLVAAVDLTVLMRVTMFIKSQTRTKKPSRKKYDELLEKWARKLIKSD